MIFVFNTFSFKAYKQWKEVVSLEAKRERLREEGTYVGLRKRDIKCRR